MSYEQVLEFIAQHSVVSTEELLAYIYSKDIREVIQNVKNAQGSTYQNSVSRVVQ